MLRGGAYGDMEVGVTESHSGETPEADLGAAFATLG